MTANTITLADVETITGIKASKWERNGTVRHYINVPGAAYKVYWTEAGKLHFALTNGRSTDEASKIAKALLGCSVIDRRSHAAAYVVVEG